MTPIRLYDTMRREKVEFRPLDPNCVRMYVCGPTVYDNAHIGNARPAIVFDVLFRLLRHVYGEENVVYVRNITDVDDKIIDRARRDYPDMDLNEAIRHVTETTTAQYQADMAALGCLPPTHEPRATENIPQMVALVEKLIRNGHAYEATGPDGREVLFDVESMEGYGALSNRRLDQQRAGARIEAKDHKRHPGDFVLWKEAKEGEPGWNSPFGRGRPGWHLECSAMSDRFLWEELRERLGDDVPAHRFDIHGGGIDLTFPHHENEIAQTCCGFDVPEMAGVWMHNGYLQVEGRKMSKSEGNFVTVHDLLHTEKFGGRRWPGEVLRLAMLMTHYREPIDFSVRRLEEALAKRNRYADALQSAVEEFGRRTVLFEGDANASTVFDDLATRSCLFELDRGLKEGLHTLQEAQSFARTLDLLGLEKLEFESAQVEHAWHMIDHGGQPNLADFQGRIDERKVFLANRNFAEADRIRDELAAEGIQLMDYKDPETGERRTKWEVKR